MRDLSRALLATTATAVLLTGPPIPAAPERATPELVRQWKAEAKKNDAEAQYRLGLARLRGDNIDQSMEEAAKLLTAAAEQGHAEAQFSVAGMYQHGSGVTRDMGTAVEWLRLAATQGLAPAQQKLGLLYVSAIADPTGDPDVERWLAEAAKTNAVTKYRVGRMYLLGDIVPQSDETAREWFAQAVEQSSGLVIMNMLENDDLILRAAELGLPEAEFGVGRLYAQGTGVPKSGAEAVRWYRLAADHGILQAQLTLGHVYMRGVGIPKDVDEAIRWYLIAAERGDAEAQLNLGFIYSSEQNEPVDLVQAHMWFNLAAAAGLREAGARRDKISIGMEPNDIIAAEKAAIEWRSEP
jgi:TPR repeat protein